MQAYFMTFTKRLNSTKQPSITGLTPVDIEFKDNVTLVNPVFRVQTLTQPIQYNYLYVPSLVRYYFVSNWEYTPGEWLCHCACDVMGSFKGEIEGTEKYILRSSSNPSKYVPDNYYMSGVNVDHEFVRAYFLVNNQPWSRSLQSGYYVVGMIGNGDVTGSTSGSVRYWVLSPVTMAKLMRYMLSGVSSNWHSIDDLTNQLSRLIADPIQYIVSCMWFPYPPPADPNTQIITFGFFAALDPDSPYDPNNPVYLYGNPLSSPHSVGKWSVDMGDKAGYSHFDSAYAWAYSEPASTYILQCNPWGTFPIQPQLIAGFKYLCFTINTDFITGMALCQVYAWGDSTNIVNPGDADFDQWDNPLHVSSCHLITSKSAQVGVQIQLSQNTSTFLSPITGGISGAINGALSGAGGGVLGSVLGGVAGAIGGVANNLTDKFSSTGSNGGICGDEGEATLHILRKHFGFPLDGNGNIDISELGTTCGQLLQIGNLTGYVQCADGNIATTATETEKKMISDFLTGGFYVEN